MEAVKALHALLACADDNVFGLHNTIDKSRKSCSNLDAMYRKELSQQKPPKSGKARAAEDVSRSVVPASTVERISMLPFPSCCRVRFRRRTHNVSLNLNGVALSVRRSLTMKCDVSCVSYIIETPGALKVYALSLYLIAVLQVDVFNQHEVKTHG